MRHGVDIFFIVHLIAYGPKSHRKKGRNKQVLKEYVFSYAGNTL